MFQVIVDGAIYDFWVVGNRSLKCVEKGQATSAQNLLEASSMIADSSSSSQPKAVAVAHDTIEFSEPSGHCATAFLCLLSHAFGPD
ncbi:Os08g0224601 [Oryza sativa Japonica Group]|uniref:Os08g0224601 protein n=1 Tax=Oryza sativa subsp. japonica TaxID=39947 RepID=A0A0P0XD06_ORYSJ|nr:Os08g0224601 [Oryza sativa Japonica Group]